MNSLQHSNIRLITVMMVMVMMGMVTVMVMVMVWGIMMIMKIKIIVSKKFNVDINAFKYSLLNPPQSASVNRLYVYYS